MKHFQSKVLTAAILAALSGSAIAADVYLKNEVYSKEEVNTEIANAKTAVEEKITAAKKELGDKLDNGSKEIKAVKKSITDVAKLLTGDPKDDQNPGLIDSISDLNKTVNGDVDEESGNKKTPGLVDTVAELDKSVKSNKSEIGELKTGLTTANTNADNAVKAANEAKQLAKETKDNVDENVKAATKAAENAKTQADNAQTAANTAEAAAAKVTDIKEAADEALGTAYLNAQDINGFGVGDDIYVIDKEGNVTSKKATQEDVENDDFAGLGLKEIVGQHDENLENLTETVNKNSETLDNTVDVVNQHTEDLTAVKTAINKNEDAINDTKDDLALVAATAINNAQEINGFKAGEDIYDIDEKTGKITKKPATDTDVEADDLKGKGLKKVVVEHDQSLKGLTETVKKNTDDIATKAEKTELDKVSKKADKNADDIATKAEKTELDKVSKKADKNADDIATKAEKTELDKVSKKADKNADDIATKADKANVYTKTESDSRFVKVESSIGGLDTTTKGLDTRLTSAEKSVADHGTRLASAEKSITEHGTRLNGLDKTVSDLRKETRQGLAEQAALSGLFQPYNVGRFNVTAAVGGYKSESAVAIGTGFRFTENFAAKAGVAVGTSSGSSAAYHVGVNYEW
ncbi:YadA-like family protein [Neisseria cinerea]|uniref:YadA-like family protein n=1 Tax=Neisseria cinerea TaxID=483 RepID=UPI002B1DC24D|nr:YadA-like family protein [Neisseria cinerea]